MSGLDEVQVADVVTISVTPLLIVATAVYWDVAPTAGAAPVTVTVDTTDGAVVLPPHAVTRRPKPRTANENETVLAHVHGFRLIRTCLNILPSPSQALAARWLLCGSDRALVTAQRRDGEESVADTCKVLQGSARFYRVLQGSFWVLQGSGFHRVLQVLAAHPEATVIHEVKGSGYARPPQATKLPRLHHRYRS